MVDAILDVPLDVLRLPTRLQNFAERRGLATVRDLVALPPGALLLERHLGAKTLADTHAVLAEYLGRAWEDERLAMGLDSAPTDSDSVEVRSTLSVRWDRLAAALPGPILDAPLAEIALPARMSTFASAAGITVVRDLVSWQYETLLKVPNLGRKTLSDSISALERTDGTPAEVDQVMPYTHWLVLLQGALGSLPSTDRLIMTQRAGLSGVPPTLAELGELLGVSRERIRQREQRAVERIRDSGGWVASVVRRLASAEIAPS